MVEADRSCLFLLVMNILNVEIKMTPLRKAAIAFSELSNDYVPTEIVDMLYDHHYLTRDADFLARCYSN